MKNIFHQLKFSNIGTQQDEQLKAQEARLKELEAKLNAILNK
ncbi:MAG: hypothetical protein Q8K70_04895 [Bacteroidota bacterium]|nr:hypothetical protein [Bacteroidota bacterium]